MKQKRLTLFGQIFLIVWLVFCILIIWAINNVPRYQPTIINIDNPFVCEEVDGELIRTSKFKVGQTIYVCGRVRLSDPSLSMPIQIRVYEGERTFGEREIFYDNVVVSSGDETVVVDAYLFPGNYEIQISDGRRVLGSVQIEIIDQ
jgi:hypothetical protein